MRINPERKEERERITAALLRATLDLAAAHGFASLGLREVSRAAGIAPTSFYRHFADMEALGLGLIEELAGPLVRGWVEHARKTTRGARGLVDGIAARALESAGDDPVLVRFVIAERVRRVPVVPERPPGGAVIDLEGRRGSGLDGVSRCLVSLSRACGGRGGRAPAGGLRAAPRRGTGSGG